MSAPDGFTVHLMAARDGVPLAWRELGAGRPVVLVHGYMSDGITNWVRYGAAAKLAEAGFRVILPDLRGHGASGHPHDPAAYPPGVLAEDVGALIRHLGLTDYDLGGYSLGARTVARVVAHAAAFGLAAPRRLVLAGMGLDGMVAADRRVNHFRAILDGLGTHAPRSPEWFVEAFLKTTRADPVAMRHVLETFVPVDPEDLARIPMPVLLLCGAQDQDNGSAAALARALPDGHYEEIPGNHMNAITRPEFGQALVGFLNA